MPTRFVGHFWEFTGGFLNQCCLHGFERGGWQKKLLGFNDVNPNHKTRVGKLHHLDDGRCWEVQNNGGVVDVDGREGELIKEKLRDPHRGNRRDLRVLFKPSNKRVSISGGLHKNVYILHAVDVNRLQLLRNF